jgi:site-specific DNA recombinase
MKVLQGRMKEGRDQAYREGKFLGGGCPPPYIYDKGQGRPVPDPELLKQAQQVWKLAETMSARKIAITLDMPFISTRRMLADDRLLFYQAKRQGNNGDIIDCDWQPVITPEQAERIRAGRRAGYTGPRREAGGLLSNLNIMYCGYCGKTYRGWKGQTRKNGTFLSYYGCQGKATKGSCRSKMINQIIIDERIITNIIGTLDRINELKNTWAALQDNSDDTARIKQLELDQTRNDTNKKRLIAAVAEGIIDFADAKHQLDEIKNTLDAIKKEKGVLTAAQQKEPDWDALTPAKTIFREMDQTDKREFITHIIKQIRVFSTYLIIDYLFPRSIDGNHSARVHLPTIG